MFHFKSFIKENVQAESNEKHTKSEVPYNPYEGKYFSILGDSISIYKGKHVPVLPFFCKSKNAKADEINSMDDTWWGMTIKRLGGKLLVNNSAIERRITNHSGKFDAKSYCFTHKLHTKAIEPDVIIINLGIFDWINCAKVGLEKDGKTHDTMEYFAFAYQKIVREIQNNYKGAEVWCCCLAYGNISSNTEKVSPIKHNNKTIYCFNRVIIDTAENLGCKCIDFYGAYGSVDGIRPNKSGMKKISDSIISYMEANKKACILHQSECYSWEEYYYDYIHKTFYLENHCTGSVDDAADYIASMRDLTDREMYEILKKVNKLNLYEKNKLLFHL